MNSSRSSSLVALLFALVVTVGGAGAVTVSDATAPAQAEVGTDVQAQFVLGELFMNPSLEQWNLVGDTELQRVTWTVQVSNQAGTQIDQQSYDGATFEHPVDIEDGDHRLRVTVTGTVPAVGNYTYDPEEEFLLAQLSLSRQGGTSEVIEDTQAHHFTEDSRAARDAIDGAQATIDDAGGHAEAERTLNSAIDAYESENFQLAIDLAEQADDTASRARSAQTRNQLILMGVGTLIVVGLLVGVFLYWQRTRSHSRL